jgi:hypothetical protein
MARVTKAHALAIFKEEWDNIVEAGVFRKDDKPALRESWNNFTDSLCKDGMITEHQYNTWTHPF